MTVCFSPSNDAGFHLAAEEYFLKYGSGELLFLYVNSPCVVIGSNQNLRAEVDVEYCRAEDIGVFRRLSGGGAVYHDPGNLNYCFIRNKVPGVPVLSGDFMDPVVEVLLQEGVPVEVGKRKDLWLPTGFKVSGTASHVGKERVLHHGTLLYDADLLRLERSLRPADPGMHRAVPSVPSPVQNIRNYLREKGLPDPAPMDFFRNLALRWLELLGSKSLFPLQEDVRKEMESLAEDKYRSEAWTFKK